MVEIDFGLFILVSILERDFYFIIDNMCWNQLSINEGMHWPLGHTKRLTLGHWAEVGCAGSASA